MQEMVEHEFDNVFMAIGRTPEVNGLNLEKLGIQLDKGKKIITNNRY